MASNRRVKSYPINRLTPAARSRRYAPGQPLWAVIYDDQAVDFFSMREHAMANGDHVQLVRIVGDSAIAIDDSYVKEWRARIYRGRVGY